MVHKMFPFLNDAQNLFFFYKISAYHIHFETQKHRKLFLVYSVIPILAHNPLKTILYVNDGLTTQVF